MADHQHDPRRTSAAAPPAASTATSAPAVERAHDPGCLLCQAERITPWFYEDEVCWIAACEICSTPMVVWRGHGPTPPDHERAHMLARLAEVATRELGAHWVDDHMRKIPTHFHAHARPEGGFFGPGGRRPGRL